MERRIVVTGSPLCFAAVILLIVVSSCTVESVPLSEGALPCRGSGCCSECPAGWAASQPCNVTSETTTTSATTTGVQCQSCQSGVTFNDAPGADAVCRTCRVCPANSRVERACDTTSDTQCQCLRDFYLDVSYVAVKMENATQIDLVAAVEMVEAAPNATQRLRREAQTEPETEPATETETMVKLSECRACELCAHGWGAARACSPHQNTVCRKCPSGTFSSILSASLACSVCSVCRHDQVTLHECTPIQDTVCADKDMGHPSRRVITKSVEAYANANAEYNNEGIISVYCAILGAIVLGLLIYVVMKQWRLRTAAKKLAHFEPRHGGSASVPLNGGSSAGDDKSAPHHFQCDISPCGSRRLDESDGSRGSRGSDSAFVAPGSDGYSRDVKLMTLDTRLREICTAKRREMEVMLNARRDQRDWKALARDLGYTSTRIASFEQRATEKQTGPTRHLFADWAKREDSTVENLLRSLVNIGRHDVTLVMLPIQERSATTLPRTTRYKPVSVV